MLFLAIKLIAVAGVLGGVVIVMARMAGGNRGKGTGVRVVARHGLSRTALVAVVEVDGRRFLVGAGDNTVSMLTELDAAEDTVEAYETAELDELAESPVPTVTRRLATAGSWLAAAHQHSRTGPLPMDAQGMGAPTSEGPRIGPLDRLRALTVRTANRPIHVKQIT